ncbi:ABC transporter permease [Virgisporangium aliadipatigenens]|uniref:ABC transporter permease n=1 Tax=Virgisporangium aliadipatigenens TaxID=741659 RepID=A0A8J3YPI5_9ACTN|nr:carbohydrate ABC transporter permease [Virgisporangium aliadipatigenens]GIJ49319.1 ABC transporter permease [Virgisporangium aliadipatigenens]
MTKALKGALLTLCCALVVVPFLGIVATSVSTREDIVRNGGFVLIPREITFAAYRALLTGGVVPRAVGVSVFITLVGTALSLVATTLLAYGLSRPGSFGHRPVLMLVVAALLFTPGIIPGYLTVSELGLLDTYWAVILPAVVNAFNVVILRAFFMELPSELLESARIDGASDGQTFVRIVLPLSKAVLSVIGLFYAVGYWNAFFSALLYLNDSAKWPVQLVLRTYVVNQTQLGVDQVGTANLPPQEALQMAILVVSIVPILLIYPFVQRHFTKGVLVGAVKG